MDIYRLGDTTIEPVPYERGDHYLTEILLNPGEEVYLHIGKILATEDELKRHRRDLQNICKFLNHQQRVQEELFDKNDC